MASWPFRQAIPFSLGGAERVLNVIESVTRSLSELHGKPFSECTEYGKYTFSERLRDTSVACGEVDPVAFSIVLPLFRRHLLNVT